MNETTATGTLNTRTGDVTPNGERRTRNTVRRTLAGALLAASATLAVAPAPAFAAPGDDISSYDKCWKQAHYGKGWELSDATRWCGGFSSPPRSHVPDHAPWRAPKQTTAPNKSAWDRIASKAGYLIPLGLGVVGLFIYGAVKGDKLSDEPLIGGTPHTEPPADYDAEAARMEWSDPAYATPNDTYTTADAHPYTTATANPHAQAYAPPTADTHTPPTADPYTPPSDGSFDASADDDPWGDVGR